MTMQYRPLGKTGLSVSEIGFGTWGIGSTEKGAIGYGKTDDGDALKALQAAFDAGVNFYDTADLYGYGHSETLIGKAFGRMRDKVIIASKAGFLDDAGEQDFSPRHVRQALEGSLKRLQTNYVDLYQLHCPTPAFLGEGAATLDLLQSLVAEGKIRHLGISVRSPGEARLFLEQWDFQAVQLNFNLTDQRALRDGTLAFCRDKGVGVIVRTPLCSGFLTGRYADGEIFSEGDHRRLLSARQIQKWNEAGTLFAEAVGNDGDQTAAQMALRYCLSYDSVSTVIPGMLNRDHVRENTLSSSLGKFLPETVCAIEKVYAQNAFFLKENK